MSKDYSSNQPAKDPQPLPQGLRIHWFLTRIWSIIEMLVYAFWIAALFGMYRGRFNLAGWTVLGLGFAVIGLVLSFFLFRYRKELSLREYRLCVAKRLVFLPAAFTAAFLTDFFPYAERFVISYLMLISVRFALRILILIYYLRRRKLFQNSP